MTARAVNRDAVVARARGLRPAAPTRYDHAMQLAPEIASTPFATLRALPQPPTR